MIHGHGIWAGFWVGLCVGKTGLGDQGAVQSIHLGMVMMAYGI